MLKTDHAASHSPDPNESIQTISGVSTDGRGIAKIDERAVFIDRCLPGDIVRIRPDWTSKPPSAIVIERLTVSPDRITHPCPHAADCPACPFGEWNYEQQLSAKTELVERTLGKQLDGIEVRNMIPSPEPWHYRNRISLRLEQEQEKIFVGYRQGSRAQAFVPLTACKLAMPDIDQCLGDLQNLLRNYRGGTTDKLPVRIQIHQTAKGAGLMVVFPMRIHASQRKFWRNWLTGLNVPGGVWFATGNRAGVIGSKSWIEPDQGAEPMLTSWMGETLKIHPGSFCQSNSQAAELVCKRIAVWSQRHQFRTVWDLYGGFGALGLAARGKSASVKIIESSKWSEPISQTLAETAGCKKPEFHQGNVLTEFKHLSHEVSEQDLVILDPPSSGVHKEVLDLINESEARKLCYLSCNPAKLGRDLALLAEGGFKITELQPYDFFPQTASIEVLALLSR